MAVNYISFDDAARALRAVAGDLRQPDANRHAAALAFDVLTTASRAKLAEPTRVRRTEPGYGDQEPVDVLAAVRCTCGTISPEMTAYHSDRIHETARLLGNLVDVLHTRGLLSRNDLLAVLGDGWGIEKQ